MYLYIETFLNSNGESTERIKLPIIKNNVCRNIFYNDSLTLYEVVAYVLKLYISRKNMLDPSIQNMLT